LTEFFLFLQIIVKSMDISANLFVCFEKWRCRICWVIYRTPSN